MQSSAILLARTFADKAPTRIQLCGRLAVELEGRELTPRLPGGQARVLLTYLVINRSVPARRDELIEAIWPGRPPAGADASLSALLSRLRSVLGADVLSGGTPVTWRLPVAACLEAAHEAIHRAESAVAQADWARAWGPSLVAFFTARRGLLPGEDLPWVEEHRRRLEEIRTAALECYAAVALGVGGTELAPGGRVARELVALEPYRERGHALSQTHRERRGVHAMRTCRRPRMTPAGRTVCHDEVSAPR